MEKPKPSFLALYNYDFDSHKLVDMPFISKLMNQNMWSEEFAEEVILEYKKFIYLICTFGKAAPSYFIDQVWHLHILYTKDYEAFCKKFNGEFIHHNPDRYFGTSDDLFKKTLLNYQKSFNKYPPEHIWKAGGNFKTINLNDHYVIPTGEKKILLKLLKKEICG